MATRIWTFNDLAIAIYASDENGSLPADGATPLLSYCYVDTASLDGSLEIERRDRDCLAERELVATTAWDNYAASVNGIYLSKGLEFNVSQIFNRDAWLVVEFLCSARPKADDRHLLACCKAEKFQLSGSDNQNLIYNASFQATRYS